MVSTPRGLKDILGDLRSELSGAMNPERARLRALLDEAEDWADGLLPPRPAPSAVPPQTTLPAPQSEDGETG